MYYCGVTVGCEDGGGRGRGVGGRVGKGVGVGGRIQIVRVSAES